MRYALAMLSALILTGCASQTKPAVTVDSVCAIWPTTSWSKKDTDETIAGNKFNNARRSGFCGE